MADLSDEERRSLLDRIAALRAQVAALTELVGDLVQTWESEDDDWIGETWDRARAVVGSGEGVSDE